MPPLPPDDLAHILEHTAWLWAEARGQRIFLTGGTGFIGCWLVESFLAANKRYNLEAELTVLTRSPEAFLQKCPHLATEQALHLVRGDVRNFDFSTIEHSGKGVAKQGFPFVIHAATETDARQWQENPASLNDQAVSGSLRVIDFALSHGTRKFLFTSSGAVYGTQPPEIGHLAEDYAGGINSLRPSTIYGEGKLEVENHLLALDSPMAVKIARCFAFTGPYLPLDEHFAIGNFMADLLANRAIEIRGDGRPLRSYFYAADLAIWLWTILFRGTAGSIYNVGAEEAISILELAQMVASLQTPPLEIHVVQSAGSGEPPRYIPSTTRAQDELQLRQYIPLKEALQRHLQWLLNK